ncbi:hypothetical protein PVAND_003112 [Polypedilum vanderplanki]|uniref:Uncharacterized protein n=1 Tax=Polypedilum vanderplanki TaxID=319348 RepID=A0A9J6BTH1_POLVA|nr:hypothetical protein PVAND_003112 [Polypedilum vanderplanki]
MVVNNADTGLDKSLFDENSDAAEKINAVIDTNFTRLVHCTRKTVRLMRKSNNHGLIVNIGTSIFDENQSNVYFPSKASVNGFSKIIRQESIFYKYENIHVTNMCPSYLINPEGFDEGYIGKNEQHLNPQNIHDVLETSNNINVAELGIKYVAETFFLIFF